MSENARYQLRRNPKVIVSCEVCGDDYDAALSDSSRCPDCDGWD